MQADSKMPEGLRSIWSHDCQIHGLEYSFMCTHGHDDATLADQHRRLGYQQGACAGREHACKAVEAG